MPVGGLSDESVATPRGNMALVLGRASPPVCEAELVVASSSISTMVRLAPGETIVVVNG